MKVLPTSIITAVSASSAHANYPASNMLDEHPKKVWKGTGATETLTFTISDGSNCFFLFNTNATGVSFVLVDPNYIEWEAGTAWETGVAWATNEAGETVVSITELNGTSGACMATWTTIPTTVNLVVSLANENGDVLKAGVAVGGAIKSYRDPSYEGFSEGVKDYSITAELSNGATYYKGRDAVRVFNLSVLLARDTSFDDFIFNVAKVVKSGPAAWAITDETDSRWLAYARFTKMPTGEHSTPDWSTVNFELTEVV